MNDYYYEYGDYYTTSGNDLSSSLAIFTGGFMFFYLAIIIFMLVCMVKIYTKAGRKWWEALVPIYNIIVLLEIVELPLWYIALFFIPFANVYAIFKIYIELAHKFGKSTGFGVAMIFFSIICMPMLAFGKATYQGSINTQNDFYANQNNNINQPIQPTITPQYQQPMPGGYVAPTPDPVQPMPGGYVAPTPEPTQPMNGSYIPPIPQPTTNIENPNMKFCSNCGIQVGSTITSCPNCGNNF